MNITKNKIDWFAQAYNEIENNISRASSLYNTLLKEADIHDDDHLWYDGNIIYVNDDGFHIDWEITWSYGGHARGSCTILNECLIDETWREETIKEAKKVIKKYKNEERSKLRVEKNNEKANYLRLKEKYEGEIK